MKTKNVRRLMFAVLSEDNVLSSLEGDIDLPPNVYVSQLVWDSLSRQREPAKVLLVDDETGEQMTANDILRTASQMSYFLLDHGVQEGETVFAYAVNSPSYACLVLSSPCIGSVLAGCLTSYPLPALLSSLHQSHAVVLFCSSGTLVTSIQALDLVDELRFLIVLDRNEGGVEKSPATGKPIYGMHHVMSHKPEKEVKLPIVPLKKSPADAPAFLHSSSGSTGRPKIVARSQGISVRQVFEKTTNYEVRNYDDVVSGRLLLPHTTGPLLVLKMMYRGVKLVIPSSKKTGISDFMDLIERHSVTHIITVPTLMMAMAKSESLADISCLKSLSVFGSVASESMVQSFRLRFPDCRLISQMYGTTEAGVITYADQSVLQSIPSDERRGSVGRVVRGSQVRIVDPETGHNCSVHQVGEIQVHGSSQVDGYFEDEEATRANFTGDKNFWFKSGDAAYFDDRGLVYIVDRYKVIMKVDGIQVSPSELESLLLMNESVTQAAVVAVPDASHGEVPRAFLLLSPGHEVDLKAMLDQTNSRLPPHKRIRSLWQVKQMPMLGVGKIDRRALQVMEAEEAVTSVKF